MPVQIVNGERVDSAGGIYLTNEILEEIQEIVGLENARISE